MFTGIIEEQGEVIDVAGEGNNLHFRIAAKMTSELKIDQSVAHNGVCLTVVDIGGVFSGNLKGSAMVWRCSHFI